MAFSENTKHVAYESAGGRCELGPEGVAVAAEDVRHAVSAARGTGTAGAKSTGVAIQLEPGFSAALPRRSAGPGRLT